MPGTVEGTRIQLEGIGHLLQDSRLAVPSYQRIGKLALMKKSKSEAGGKTKFSEKVKLYAKSESKPTSGLSAFAEKGQWTTAAIDACQKALATLAVQAWPNKVLLWITPETVPW